VDMPVSLQRLRQNKRGKTPFENFYCSHNVTQSGALGVPRLMLKDYPTLPMTALRSAADFHLPYVVIRQPTEGFFERLAAEGDN